MGLFDSPPTPDPATAPDIPVADFKTQARQQVQGQKEGGFWERFIALWYNRFKSGIQAVIWMVAGGIDDIILTPLVELLTAMQGLDHPGFFRLMSAIIGDLLGVEANPEAIQSSFNQRGRIGAMTTVGGQFFDMLKGEFHPSQTDNTIVPTADPAKAFIGFLLEFAIRQGNVALFCEFLPIEFNVLAGLREYGELMAKNLGLGRLARRALQPMINTLVAEPLQWSMNKQYRPKMLSESQLIKAYQKGSLPLTDLKETLARQGYSDAAIDLLIPEHSTALSASEILSLVRAQQLPADAAVAALKERGMSEEMAKNIWDATTAEPIQPLVHSFLNEVKANFRNGFMDWASVQTVVAAMPLTDQERGWWLKIIGNNFGPLGKSIPVHTRHLSEAQLERAFLEGILDLSALQNTWQAYGYTPDAINTLTLLVMQKLSSGQKTKTGHTTVRTLSEAQLEKAYANGIINLTQFQNGLIHLGYSDDDRDILSALVQINTPAPGTTQFPGMTTP